MGLLVYIYSITFCDYTLLLSESILFQQFFKGRENEMSAHPQKSHIISGGGIFRRTGGGDFIDNLSFYIILANEVKISVWTIYPEIQTDLAHIPNRIFSGGMLLHPKNQEP